MSTRLLLAALWLFHWLPLGVQAAIGSAVGRLGWHLVASRRKVALRNLELCFPELGAGERERARARALPLARPQPARARPALVRVAGRASGG